MRIVILLVAALAASAPAATTRFHAARKDAGRLGSGQVDPRSADRIKALARHLADLPDGSYISAINGRRWAIEARAGGTLIIDGKGFDQRRAASLAGLFAPGQTTGALLTIASWSDTRIVASLPANNRYLTADTNTVRLSLQVVRANGVQLSLDVAGIRFRAS